MSEVCARDSSTRPASLNEWRSPLTRRIIRSAPHVVKTSLALIRGEHVKQNGTLDRSGPGLFVRSGRRPRFHGDCFASLAMTAQGHGEEADRATKQSPPTDGLPVDDLVTVT